MFKKYTKIILVFMLVMGIGSMRVAADEQTDGSTDATFKISGAGKLPSGPVDPDHPNEWKNPEKGNSFALMNVPSTIDFGIGKIVAGTQKLTSTTINGNGSSAAGSAIQVGDLRADNPGWSLGAKLNSEDVNNIIITLKNTDVKNSFGNKVTLGENPITTNSDVNILSAAKNSGLGITTVKLTNNNFSLTLPAGQSKPTEKGQITIKWTLSANPNPSVTNMESVN
ncbi:WxL domain-containing protein [Periweissella fabalis]|uniref:WxL domain-containing protein n=1 Tax=Periweissella fabalis TaxID=1070421 RepID=A0A7X6N533_9LACO|nr:WxL domain-containing protein [Periweissella fabalis]MCM0598097.1 WxL domain-containing protein [Periweissella fabalis]NKZ24779.1 WxL domain-containing protein [Periweissella fabalis]